MKLTRKILEAILIVALFGSGAIMAGHEANLPETTLSAK